MVKIGIFWVYKNTVIGKALDLYEGHENIPGLIDSPDSHIDLWENNSSFVLPFTELRGSEYQEIPRGRVMYSSKDNASLVYMDKVLHLDGYTTESQIIYDYFDDHGH